MTACGPESGLDPESCVWQSVGLDAPGGRPSGRFEERVELPVDPGCPVVLLPTEQLSEESGSQVSGSQESCPLTLLVEATGMAREAPHAWIHDR